VPGALSLAACEELLNSWTSQEGRSDAPIGVLSHRRLEQAAEALGVVRVLRAERIWGAITALLGDDWVLILNRHNHLTENRGPSFDANRLHRDALSWTRGYLSILLALTPMSDPSSWTRVVPGSHLWPISGPPNGGGYWMDETNCAGLSSQAVLVPWERGSALVLDSMAFHSAGVGTPLDSRVVLTLAVRASDELAASVAANEALVSGHHHYRGQHSWWERRDWP
jgi:ectoine hydroxylase-related dioxygenase (phytanoyl-CoA dioxygenase family)